MFILWKRFLISSTICATSFMMFKSRLRSRHHYLSSMSDLSSIRLTERGSREPDTLLDDVPAALVELELEVGLLLRLSTGRVVWVDGLVLQVGVELVDPLLEDSEQHDRV